MTIAQKIIENSNEESIEIKETDIIFQYETVTEMRFLLVDGSILIIKKEDEDDMSYVNPKKELELSIIKSIDNKKFIKVLDYKNFEKLVKKSELNKYKRITILDQTGNSYLYSYDQWNKKTREVQDFTLSAIFFEEIGLSHLDLIKNLAKENKK